jgi:hypothetical protein
MGEAGTGQGLGGTNSIIYHFEVKELWKSKLLTRNAPIAYRTWQSYDLN